MIFCADFGIIHGKETREDHRKEKNMLFGFLQNMGPWQLVICLIVAFVLFGGAKKIPELAKALGKAKNEFKKGLEEGEKESVEAEKAEDAKPEPAKELV